VSPAAENDGFFESAQVRLGRRQRIVEYGDFLLKEHFGLISLRRERVKSIGEAVVKDSQRGNALGWNNA